MGFPDWIPVAFVCLLLGGWSAAVILRSLTLRWPIRLRLLNHPIAMRFVPQWNFFAPRPGSDDFHVLWRQVGTGVGPWREVHEMVPPRRLTNVLWNPDKRSRKATIDISVQLIGESELAKSIPGGPERIPLSLPYLLLAWATSASASRSPLVEYFQFAIASDSLATPGARPLFLSRVHTV